MSDLRRKGKRLQRKRKRLGELWDLAHTTAREVFIAQESQALADQEAKVEAERQQTLASYQGHVAVILREEAYYSGKTVWLRGLFSKADFQLLLDNNPGISFGEIDGKHSDVNSQFKDLIYQQGDTPEEILDIMEQDDDKFDDFFSYSAFTEDGAFDNLYDALESIKKSAAAATSEVESDKEEEDQALLVQS